ncbi:MAG: FdtA/QdtA family cupin domain-containing protein [Muribaculaceae bacterium]|nr:FdtA/QdtA family cupin domain-containing protein [Muribaculaceae bacterium]
MNRQELKMVTLPKICDRRGNLTFIQNGDHIPFDMQRCYWIYDVPAGRQRNGHAFREAYELIVAMSGSFEVVITHPDGTVERHLLNRSYYGLLVPPMTWRELDNFSTNSVAMVLTSTTYSPEDYIRDFDTLRKEVSDE